jgi:hypothetical protein
MKGTKEDSIGATPEATAMNLLEKFESSPEGRTEEGKKILRRIAIETASADLIRSFEEDRSAHKSLLKEFKKNREDLIEPSLICENEGETDET